MRGFDDQTGRLYQRVVGFQGMNSAAPPRSLSDGESPFIKNALLSTGNLVPGKVASETAFSSESSIDEIIYYAFQFNLTDPFLVMLGATKCWVQQTGDPVEKTPAVPFVGSTPVQWEGFTMLSDGAPVAVANNRGANPPYYWDGGEDVFLPISAAPNMRCSIGYLGRLFGGSVTEFETGEEYINRLAWSDEGDITAWAGPTSGYRDLTDEGDRIIRLAVTRGHQLLILRDGSVYTGFPTLNPFDPIATQRLARQGILARSSLQETENTFLFLGKDDIYACDGSSPPVGVGWKIRRSLFSDADQSKLYLAWSFLDTRNKDYYLVTEMKDSTQVAWIFNYEQKHWTFQDLTDYTMLVAWKKD